MRINDKSLKLLRQHVMIDPEITEDQRQSYLRTIEDVKNGLDSGRYFIIDRAQLIKDAAERKQRGRNVSFRKKLKAKGRKVRRNATEGTRSIKSLDAFDESFMYSSDDEIRKYADGIGITDVYKETKRFDEEWN